MSYQPLFVPRPGIEPGWIAPLVFETSASTDSAIWANDFADAKIVIILRLTKNILKKLHRRVVFGTSGENERVSFF